jgi:3-oxoadipate enol-lactonase
MITTTEDGIRLQTALDGPVGAPPLLFLNSLGCDLTMWDAQVRALKTKFRVIRFDTRGHGGSDAPDGDYTLERLGLDALAVLDEVGVASAHVCGLSLGGITAQWLAIHAAGRMNRLVLANTVARIGSPEIWRARAETVLAQGMGAVADGAIGRFFSEPFRTTAPETAMIFRRILMETPPQGYAGCCATLRDSDLRCGLGGIISPTLVIGGTLDVSTPPAEAAALAREIPGASLVILDAAHLSNIEQPEAFNAALLTHLETV